MLHVYHSVTGSSYQMITKSMKASSRRKERVHVYLLNWSSNHKTISIDRCYQKSIYLPVIWIQVNARRVVFAEGELQWWLFERKRSSIAVTKFGQVCSWPKFSKLLYYISQRNQLVQGWQQSESLLCLSSSLSTTSGLPVWTGRIRPDILYKSD